MIWKHINILSFDVGTEVLFCKWLDWSDHYFSSALNKTAIEKTYLKTDATFATWKYVLILSKKRTLQTFWIDFQEFPSSPSLAFINEVQNMKEMVNLYSYDQDLLDLP